MQQTLIKRTIYVAKCDICEFSDEVTDHPPRERFDSNCRKWLPYVEQSFIGKDFVAPAQTHIRRVK